MPYDFEARSPALLSALNFLNYLNNALLIPMFTIIVIETGEPEQSRFLMSNLGFCALFFLEWLVGLAAARDRRAFLQSPANLVDLLSSIPFGYLFQSLRLFRLTRMVRLFRLILRTRRWKSRAGKVLRVAILVGATIFAGAVALRTAEPETVPAFGDALWWSVVTLSTVGYGDLTPLTPTGRGVAAVLMTLGIGVFGYVAGFMASIIDGPQEDELRIAISRLEAKIDALGRSLSADAAPRGPR